MNSALVEYSGSSSDEEVAAASKRQRSNEAKARTKTEKGEGHGEHELENPHHKPAAASTRSGNLPSLPPGFLDLYATSTRQSVRDDPSLHGGRKRVIPHVPGNWPTHVYLEWYPDSEKYEALSKILENLTIKYKQLESKPSSEDTKISSLLVNDLGVRLPLHISLSRPVVLTTENKQFFSNMLEDWIEHSDVRPFHIYLDQLRWVSNTEQTRWFLVLRARRPPNNELNRLLFLSNRLLAKFGQPPLYAIIAEVNKAGPRRISPTHSSKSSKKAPDLVPGGADYSDYFHISIGWKLEKPTDEEEALTHSTDIGEIADTPLFFDSVKSKIGNNILNVKLVMVSQDNGSGFIGATR